MKRNNQPFSLYAYVAGIVGQVGCLLTITVLVSLALGFLLDGMLETEPLFIFVMLLGSVPLNIWLVFWYTRRKARSLEASTSKKEDDISGE